MTYIITSPYYIYIYMFIINNIYIYIHIYIYIRIISTAQEFGAGVEPKPERLFESAPELMQGFVFLGISGHLGGLGV